MKPTYTFKLVSGEGGLRVGDLEQNFFLFQDRGGFTSPEVAIQAVGELAKERGWNLKTIYTAENKVDRIEAFERQPSVAFTVALKVTPEFDRLLSKLAERIHGTAGQAILKGLTLLQAALDAKDEGKRLVIVDDTTNTEEDLTDLISEGEGSAL